MKFAFFIALRYLFSKKSTNVINIISWISVVGVSVGTMALIVILSVFNGFDSLITSLFSSFDSDLKITLHEGKTFTPNDSLLQYIKSHKSVYGYAETIEDNALLRHREKQYIATIKGVSDDYIKMSQIEKMIVEGEFLLNYNNKNYAVIGQGVAYYLSLGLNYVHPTIQIYVPKRDATIHLNPEEAFNKLSITPAGIFAIQQDFDSKYVIVPIDFAKKLFGYTDEISSIELKLADNANMNSVQNEIKSKIGHKYNIKNRFEQHELLFKIMKSEKWAIFFILTFILIVASFNVIGSLTMLIIDKQKDIFILQSMGASFSTIRLTFLLEGWLITFAGAIIGLILGVLLCYVQQVFGLIKLHGSGSFIIENYPVEMLITDFLYVFLTVIIIGFLAAWYPVRYITKNYISSF
jgi:lipoprotein-releasing system permease protein